ncbi:DUF362 domain-containing protein, partial [candidate division KSB1 bacterium]|nr:DUF362 domain-containing protein [candidate division KSB1 bacterium]
MKHWLDRFFRTCNKTGKIVGVKWNLSGFGVVLLPVTGLLATVWIAFRVLPRPSRLHYPCMKVAVPLSSLFLLFISGLMTSIFSFKGIKKLLQKGKVNPISLIILLFTGIAGIFIMATGSSEQGYAVYDTMPQIANEPVGDARGIFPGRVVWVHDPDATNEHCTSTFNSDGVGNNADDGWFLDKNNNQQVIDEMLGKALLSLSGTTNTLDAWDTLFKYHNSTREKGSVPYEKGEKIFIKLNVTSSWGMGFNWGNIRDDFTVAENKHYGISETSPQLVLALLRQLVDVVGVEQQDIYIGDPMKHIYKHAYDLWYTEFPNVHYMDHDRNTHGREKFVRSETAIIDYSDRGTAIPEQTDYLYTLFETCEYLINIPTLKGHERAGVTMFAKNHFGSNTRDGASHLHPGLVNPDGKQNNGDERFGYQKYRVQVDLLGHKLLHDKNLFYLMDALWAAGMEIHRPS